MINILTDTCRSIIVGNSRKDNGCTFYQKSSYLGDIDLKEICRKFINGYADAILLNDDLLNLQYKSLLELVLSDDLFTLKEKHVYNGCLRWARDQFIKKGKDENDGQQCREMLGNVLYQIILASTDSTKSASTLENCNILTTKELGLLFHSRLTGKQHPDITFNCALRKPDTVIRVNRKHGGYLCSLNSARMTLEDSLIVTVNKDVILRAVLLLGSDAYLPSGTLLIPASNKHLQCVNIEQNEENIDKNEIPITKWLEANRTMVPEQGGHWRAITLTDDLNVNRL